MKFSEIFFGPRTKCTQLCVILFIVSQIFPSIHQLFGYLPDQFAFVSFIFIPIFFLLIRTWYNNFYIWQPITGFFGSKTLLQFLITVPLFFIFGTVVEPIFGSKLFAYYCVLMSFVVNNFILVFAYILSFFSWVSDVLFALFLMLRTLTFCIIPAIWIYLVPIHYCSHFQYCSSFIGDRALYSI